MKPSRIVLWTLVAAATSPGLRADSESELRGELVGRFALTLAEVASECTDHYTDNRVAGGRISGEGGARFPPGELVRIDNIKIGAFSGLDVNISIAEPYRVSWQEGPFQLHDQRRCRAQLHFDVPREVRKDRARSRTAIESVLTVFGDPDSATAQAAWNRRKVEPYPTSWEATKREWEAWKRSQRNRLVREKSARVLEQAERVLSYMLSDEGYLASFGAGARARNADSWSSCEAMLEASFYVSGSGADTRGWSDGQLVSWATQLAGALQECYID